jgi:excisionase family DNA binding protein
VCEVTLDKMLRLAEVEAHLHVCRKTLLRWIWNGNLEGVKVGRDWRVPAEVVEAIQQHGLALTDAE